MASGVNLKEFTLAVDQAAQKMDQGLPQLLIHSIARKIPEERAQALYDYFSISFFFKYQSGEHAESGKRRIGKFTEVLGDASAKEAVLRKYWQAFPRHSAFHAELRENGMKDTRKNKTR